MVNIYTLAHPDTGEIRYVGKTKNSLQKRYNQHYYNKEGKSKISKWIRKLKKENKKPIIELLDRVAFDLWVETEIYWIAQFKAWGFNLLNITEGGESGCNGYKHTQEAIQRIKILNSRPKSEEWLNNMINGQRDKKATPIFQYDLDGNFIKEWKSFYFAAIEILPNNYQSAVKNIHACCNNKRKTAYKFKWKYKN